METLYARIRAIQIAIEGGSSAEMVMAAIERAFAAIIPAAVRDTVMLVKEAPLEIERWQQPASGPAEEDARPSHEVGPSEMPVIDVEIVENVQSGREVNGGSGHE